MESTGSPEEAGKISHFIQHDARMVQKHRYGGSEDTSLYESRVRSYNHISLHTQDIRSNKIKFQRVERKKTGSQC